MPAITFGLDAPGQLSWTYGASGTDHFLVVPTRPGWSRIFILGAQTGGSRVRFGSLRTAEPHEQSKREECDFAGPWVWLALACVCSSSTPSTR